MVDQNINKLYVKVPAGLLDLTYHCRRVNIPKFELQLAWRCLKEGNRSSFLFTELRYFRYGKVTFGRFF